MKINSDQIKTWLNSILYWWQIGYHYNRFTKRRSLAVSPWILFLHTPTPTWRDKWNWGTLSWWWFYWASSVETSWNLWGWLQWGRLVMEDINSELAVFVAKKDFQWWACIAFGWVVGWGGPTEIPKQSRLMLGQKIALWKLVESHCQGHYPHS